MTILPPLTEQEYRVFKAMLGDVDALEATYREKTGRRGFEDAEAETLRDFDGFVAVMRAAVEGYEASSGRPDTEGPEKP